MLFINFVCLFYLMVLVASHTISKSIDRSDLLDNAVDSVDDHQPQKHPRRDQDYSRHVRWWRKSSALKDKLNETKPTSRTSKAVKNAKATTIKQLPTEEFVPKQTKAKKIEKKPSDGDRQTESYKSNVTRSGKYVKIVTTKLISTSKEADKVRSKKKKKKKHKSKDGHSTKARGISDDPREKHRRELPVKQPANNYLSAATVATYESSDHTLSHYYKMLADMSTKLDKLMQLYSNTYRLGANNKAFTIPNLQALKQNNNRYTDSFQNKVSMPDTDMLESLLSEVKFRAIDMIAKQTAGLTDLITNSIITTTFAADPMLLHYDPHHANVMQMDLEGAAPTIAPSTKGINKNPVMNTVKSLKKGQYNDEEANYFVVKPGGARRDRAADNPPQKPGSTVGEQIGKKIKNIFNKVKQSVGSVQEHKIDNATKFDDLNSSSENPETPYSTSMESKFVKLKVTENQNLNKTTYLTPTSKVLVFTKLPRGKHRKGNAHSTKKHGSKHKKNRKKTTHNTSTTPMTVVTEDEDYAALSLIEQMLSREVHPNMAQLLSTAINPTIKRYYRGAVDDAETGSITDFPSHDILSSDEDPNTDSPIDETSYEGLTKKISYNDFVDGYKHYLKFEKDMGHTNFSNMVRYQAHRHHDVDDIGKFILDKLPPLPITQERYKRDFFDEDEDEQDISTKSEESWFRKHFFYLADRSVPPKKFHSSQLVPLKSPMAARDGTTGKLKPKVFTKKPEPKSNRAELQSADGDKMVDLEELAWMLKRCSSVLDTSITPQNADGEVTSVLSSRDVTSERSSRDLTSVRSAHFFNRMFGGIKRTANKSPRKHTVKKHGKRPVEDARLNRIRRHEVNKKLKSKYNYVQRDEEVNDEVEPTKSTVPSNLFDQVAAEEQKTKEKRNRIETVNATTDRAIEEGKGKKKLGYVNVELVPATTVGTLKKVKDRGKIAQFLHSFRFRVKTPEKRQKRAIKRKERCGLLKKLKQMFNSKSKKEPFPKKNGIVTRKISAYNPAKYAKNLYEIPSMSDYNQNTVYPDFITAGHGISSDHLVNFWATKVPLKAVEPTVSRVQQMYEESKDNSPELLRTWTPLRRDQSPLSTKYMTRCATKITPEYHKDNAEKLDQIRKEIDNIELKTSSPYDWSYDAGGRKLKDFEYALDKGYTPNEETKGNLHTGAILTAQSKHTTLQSNNIIDDAYTLVKKNSAVYEHHAAPLDNSVTGDNNYIYKKPYIKDDLDGSRLKAQYKDKTISVPTVADFVKDNYVINPKPTTNDDFNDLIIWNSDILHSDSVLKPSIMEPPMTAKSIKDDFAEFLKGNHVYAEHAFSNRNQKDHPISKGGKKTRAIKYKGRNAMDRWDYRRDLTRDYIVKRLDALLNRTASTERYDRLNTENYNKMMSYDTPNLRDILTDTTTLPYENYMDYLTNGMKITQNTLLPDVRSFALYKKNNSKLTVPQRIHATPLPMKHEDFDDFLKLNDIDVASVTALESGTGNIISPTQKTRTESPYNSGNSKLIKNHADMSHQIPKDMFRRIYELDDGDKKSLKWKTKHQTKPSIKEDVQNRLKEVTVSDYENQSELPQLTPESTFSYHGKNKETEPDLKPDSKPDDVPDLQQENLRYQDEMKDTNRTLKKPNRNKLDYSRNIKHNKLFYGKDEELTTQPVLVPTKFTGRPVGMSPPTRIIIKGHSYKYDIVYRGGKDPEGMVDRDRPATTNALADPEEPPDGREQVDDQLNIPKLLEPDEETGKGKNNFVLHFGSRPSDNGRVSVKDNYNFVNSLLRPHTLETTESEPIARRAGTPSFRNYFDVGAKHAQELNDKVERKRKKKRKGKREAEEDSYTAKNVAEIEVIVDLIKNPEAFEELSRASHSQSTISPVVNKEVKPLNSIQVHIGVPRYGTECHSAKRSLQNIKKVFIAKLCTPVDLEYQVKSYLIPPSTVIPTGVYLLLDNNDSLDGNLVLKPIFHNINVAVVKPRDITVHKDYSTEKITTTQTLSKLSKVTLTRDFVAAVNKHLMQLCELLSVNDTHRVRVRAADEEKPKRSLSWKRLKKYFRGEHVCDCNCKANATMCRSCAASDKVMARLIYDIDNLIKFMNDHCTEIQTFFYKNPSGGKKLKDSVKLMDKNMQNYYKRVKGKCNGKSCEGFRFLDKRFFFSTQKYKNTDSLDYFPYGINMEDVTLTENSKNDMFLDKNINKMDEPSTSEMTDTKKKTRLKTVYSLDNVNVNIICKDNNVTTTKVTPEHLDIGGQFSNAPFTEPILVRVENKFKKDLRHSNKYNKRDVGQIDSPLNADSSGSFWNDYFNKINESALIFVATGMIPDTGTSKVNNDRNETTVVNINLSTEKPSYLTTLHGSNRYDNGDRLQTRSATLSYESIRSTEAASTDKPLQEDLNELIKLLEDVYVKDFNDITMNINTITKKPVHTINTTLFKNCTCRKDINEKSKCKCAEKETADTVTLTDSTLDSIVLNSTTTYSLSINTPPNDTTGDILTDDNQILKFVANISETATEDWRSSTKESKNLFPYLKKLKDATLGWFNYDKSKEGVDIDNLTPVPREKDQLFRVMQVLGIKNKKEASTTNYAKSQGTTGGNPTILIFNDNEPFGRSSKDSHTTDIDNSSGMDVLDIHSTLDSSYNLLLSLLKYESQKLAKEWKRYAGRNHNSKKSVDDELDKEEPEDSLMKVKVEEIESSNCDNATQEEEEGMEKQKEGEQNKEEIKKCEEIKSMIKNDQKIKNKVQNEIEIKKEEQVEKAIEKEIQNEEQIISCKEKEIVKEKQKKEKIMEKLRKLKEKGSKVTQIKGKEVKIIPKEKEKGRTQKPHPTPHPTPKVTKNGKELISTEKLKEEESVEVKKIEENEIIKSMDKNAEQGKSFPPFKTLATDKTKKTYGTLVTKVVSVLEPLRKLELPAPPPGKEGLINRILNKFNVSWCTPVKKLEEISESTEVIPMQMNDYYDTDAIMSVSLITGDKGESATERKTIEKPMDLQKSNDGSDQPLRLCDLQDTFSYALSCFQQDKKWFQEYAKRIPCHRYMSTPKCFCIEPGKHKHVTIADFKEPKRTLRWDWKRNKRSLYIEEFEDNPWNDDDAATDDELLDGNTHSLRDALMSNDGFERMYKDEFGIYRIETRKKRSSVNTEAVIQGLKDLAPIEVPKNEIYAMPRDSVTMPCTLDASKSPIYWSWNEGPIPENAVVKGAYLVIQKVMTDNSGNYTCYQSGLLARKRERWTQLTVVKLPIFRIVTFLLYRCHPPCTANDVGPLRELGHHMTKAACSGSSCTVQVHRPTSMEDQTDHSSLASVFVDVAPARRAARCGVECARNMYCSLTRLIAENAATIATIPVIVSWKVRNTTLTPLVRQKIFVMQTSNLQESNPFRTQAKWTSGELDVKISCPAGFYLVYEMKLCVPNRVRYQPATPRRVRRYDWWRPSYMCVCACVVVGAACACGANALARGESAAEGGRGNRVTTLPCAEPTGTRRISPSRVILPRLFRHASSRISQETKLDLKKIRLPPPPPPPIDFDP